MPKRAFTEASSPDQDSTMGRRRSNTAFKNGIAVWVYDSDSDTETVRGKSRCFTTRKPIYADSIAPRKRSGTVLRDGVPLRLDTDVRDQEREIYRAIGVRTVGSAWAPSHSVEFVWDDHQDTESSDDDYTPSGRSARRISELSRRRRGFRRKLYDIGPNLSQFAGEEHGYAGYADGLARKGPREARRMSEYSTYGYSLGAEARRAGYRPFETHFPSMRGGRDASMRERKSDGNDQDTSKTWMRE